MTTAISSRVVECLKLFRSVSIANIERGRFETWSGNVGAHQKGRSSLDSRLRDAPHISGVMVDFLDELKDALGEAKNIEHQESSDIPTGSDSDSSTDDEAFKFFFNKQESRSEQLLSTIKSIISSLLQLTVTLRRPAHLDRYIKARNIDVSYYERTDRDHIQNLFLKMSEFLTIRAVNATLTRRRFLKYSELHSQKLAVGLESCDEPGGSPIADELVFSETTASLAPRDISIPNISKPSKLEDEADLMSVTSHATSGVSMENSDRPHVPPPPADPELDGNPFVCPYCHNLINPNSRNQWKRHVYSDLRPYHCTFEICDNPDYLFQNRHDWFEHELRVHRRIYSCLYDCDRTFDSYEALKSHVISAHGKLLEQSPNLLEMSANGRQPGSAAAAKCPFCGEMLSSPKLIRSHIGRHQSRLALWALPRSSEREGSEDGEDSEDHEDGADEEKRGKYEKAEIRARSTGQPLLSMSAPSDWDVYSYAKFLVDIYPDDAIEILCERGLNDVIKLVEQRVDRACIKLGGEFRNEIKDMVEKRLWDELKVHRMSPTPSATGPPLLVMSATSDPDAYSYAKFLVDIYPEDAVKILCKRGSCDIIELVQQQVDLNCIRLGGGSRNKIKGMVEDLRWEDLKNLRGSPTQSATTIPRHYRRSGQGPPTPSSRASGSPQSQRNPSYNWIIVYGMEEPVWFTASPSGSEEYLIGEDKLERCQGLIVKWTTPAKRITLGGKMIDVSKNVHFTFNLPGDKGTAYKQFWVVRSELIRHTDVLLGYRRRPSQDGQDKAMSSPLLLEPANVPPPVPTPPQLGPYQASSATSLHSIHDNPTQIPSRLPLRTSARTATMNSGPPPFNNPPPTQPAASIMERELSRPGSASSTRTTKSSKLDTVLVQLSLEGAGNRLLPLDLTKNSDEIIPYLEPHIFKLSGGKQLDRSIHEIKITPLKETESEVASSSLDEEVFEYIWDGMVEFMRGNRTSKKPEFRLHIE